jgi:phage terminase, large subunit, PBSX family
MKSDAATIDSDIALLEWWRDLKKTNNKAFIPLFFDEHPRLVLCGGGGSGKSIFAGRKVLERVTTEEGHRWLVCRKVAKTLRDSCFAQLRGQLAEFYPGSGVKINQTDMRMTFPNGSEILFAGLDDVEKLKSIYNITGIWIEEASEVTEADYNQLTIRLRGETKYYQQIILSFNPISITHWLKKRFFDRNDPEVKTHRSTYKDNRFLPEKDRRVLEAFKDTDPYYYQVYCLGEWGVTGKTVFDGQAVSERLSRIGEPVKSGFWSYEEDGMGAGIRKESWNEDKDGPVKIFREPEEGRPYVIGGDTSGEGSDYFVAQVLDNITGEQVAILRHQYDEDTYAKQVCCLGKYYNEALVGIEANYSTYPIKRLEQLGYQNQYVRQQEDTYTGAFRKAFGFQTNVRTRPVIIGQLVEAMRDGIDTVNDRTTLEEMLTFVKNDKLRPEAEEGAHDDCVMALAIAWYLRPSQRMTPETKEAEGKVAWTQDQWDDYYNADEDGKKYLVKKWGEPKR